jgi:hypothetical protein
MSTSGPITSISESIVRAICRPSRQAEKRGRWRWALRFVPGPCHHRRANAALPRRKIALGSFPESRTILAAEAAEVAAEVEVLDVRHVNGFVVRLHVTGNFYSPTYVALWAALLRQYSTLRIFGYTRRHDEGDPIAARIASVAAEFGWSSAALPSVGR